VNVLETKGLSKIYTAKRGKEITALSDLDLIIPKGEVFGFLGPNGAGKSTTIKAIMGLIQPSAGTAFINGLPISNPASRRNVGYLPENPSFFDFLTAREYLRFVGNSFHMGQDVLSQQIEMVLDRLELSTAADRPLRGYSKGMVQRLGLAQTLLHDPDLFVYDEPMSGLDPLGRALVKDIISELKQKGKTVFFSTHITADVEAVCDRVGVIVKGELRAVEAVGSILEKGIKGYTVQVSQNIKDERLNFLTLLSEDDQKLAYFVPKHDFRHFMKILATSSVEIYLVEPVRKDIEQFFLEIVENR
jgi:ABC-2 type transport system ATP-binding protein